MKILFAVFSFFIFFFAIFILFYFYLQQKTYLFYFILFLITYLFYFMIILFAIKVSIKKSSLWKFFLLLMIKNKKEAQCALICFKPFGIV